MRITNFATNFQNSEQGYMADFETFLRTHCDDDTDRLLLSRDKWPEIDMDLAVNTIIGRRRTASKLPSWSRTEGLVFPTRLCTEQCSSEETALYKASLVRRLFGEGRPRTADLTGGIGVDSWAFAGVSSEVLHNEGNPLVSPHAAGNFARLGLDNIRTSGVMIDSTSAAPLLEAFCPDLIFLDPARRSESGRKVFLIEDCSPDILSIKDILLAHCRYILLKLSPMADISMATQRLTQVREVHCVGYAGECKELLILLDREHTGTYSLKVYDNGESMEFAAGEEAESKALTVPQAMELEGKMLFEPGKALSKAGMFNALSARTGLMRLGRSTNLYLGESGESIPKALGKCFIIRENLPLDKRSMKACGQKLGWADVSARNIPMTSELLLARLGLDKKKAPGRNPVPHVFGITVDHPDGASERRLLVTEPLG